MLLTVSKPLGPHYSPSLTMSPYTCVQLAEDCKLSRIQITSTIANLPFC